MGEIYVCFLLSGLDFDLRGFKDQILASANLPKAANAYSQLLCSILGQNVTVNDSTVTFLESSALVLSSGGRVVVVLLDVLTGSMITVVVLIILSLIMG